MPPATTDPAPLTVVLVHGAFADASSWNGVIERLQAAGVQVTAPTNPLRGISIDSAYIASFLNQIPGPVLAVGHSYGGAVISNAATNAANVVGLVFVLATARRPPLSSRSIRRSSTMRSPPTCRPPRPR
jgi:pimeloyl-ACP methyl ester carboxylesterase